MPDKNSTINLAPRRTPPETRFHVIANTVPGIVYEFTMNDKGEQAFPYVSPRIHDFLGLNPAEVMTDASVWVNQIHQDDLPSFIETVTTSFTDLTPWHWVGRMINLNGSTGWFRGESIPERKNDSVLWTGIVIDITQMKLSEQRFQDISNTVPGIVYQFSRNDNGEQAFPYVSPRITEQIGLNYLDVMRDPSLWMNQIYKEDLPGFIESLTASFTSLTPWHWKGRLTHLNGNLGWFQSDAIPVRNNDSVVWTGIIIDITEQQLTEKKLLAAHNELEQRVKERTAELETAMQQTAVASNAKSEFLSHISHELRTPLNAISGFCQILLMDDLSHEQKDSLNEISRAGAHLLYLVEDILNLNSIELGQIDLKNEQVELHSLIADAISLVKNQATKNNTSIKNEVNVESKTHLFLDALRFKQVIINFLSNAIKYNKENGLVTIKADIDNNHAKISVSDTGKGIKEKYLSQLFKPFERLGMEGGIIEGTGIGLTLSKKITEAMGGTIGYTTKEGEGSTFWASFPVFKQPE